VIFREKDYRYIELRQENKSKVIPITGRGGLQGSEMLRMPHCLDSRLTDGGKVVSTTSRPRSSPQKIALFLVLISVRG
jgi:hypothetical protein